MAHARRPLEQRPRTQRVPVFGDRYIRIVLIEKKGGIGKQAAADLICVLNEATTYWLWLQQWTTSEFFNAV